MLATITVFSFLEEVDSKEACPVFEVAGIVTLFSSSVVSGLLTALLVYLLPQKMILLNLIDPLFLCF